ncbi:hypothetical protein [Owenweeksia hongkongensis]
MFTIGEYAVFNSQTFANCALRTANYGLWTMDYGLWTMDYGLWTMEN